MVRFYKQSDRRKAGGGLEKYYVQCKDPNDTSAWLQQPHAMDVNKERAIVGALLVDGIVRKNQRIVVKLGTSPLLVKEYTIGETLKNIPGFIRFVCKMECNDDVTRYQRSPSARICSGNTDDPLVNVLVMPYMALGSVRAFPWERATNSAKFRSCLKQIILSLYCAFVNFGFLHTDIHMDNVLLASTGKEFISYTLPTGHVETVPSEGIRVVTMDFENSFMNVAPTNTTHFFRDISRIFQDLLFAAKLQIPREIIMFAEQRSYTRAPLEDVFVLLSMLDKLHGVEKVPEPSFVYNPIFNVG